MFSYEEHKGSLIGIEGQQAAAAADKIEEFITQIQIEGQVGWTTQLPRTEHARLAPLRCIAGFFAKYQRSRSLLKSDAAGHEQLKVSRLRMDVVGSGIYYSQKPEFTEPWRKVIHDLVMEGHRHRPASRGYPPVEGLKCGRKR